MVCYCYPRNVDHDWAVDLSIKSRVIACYFGPYFSVNRGKKAYYNSFWDYFRRCHFDISTTVEEHFCNDVTGTLFRTEIIFHRRIQFPPPQGWGIALPKIREHW